MRAPIFVDVAAFAAVLYFSALAWLCTATFRKRPQPMRITRAKRRSLRRNRYLLPGERS